MAYVVDMMMMCMYDKYIFKITFIHGMYINKDFFFKIMEIQIIFLFIITANEYGY